jgi:A/G-specific adenine glycosylase
MRFFLNFAANREEMTFTQKLLRWYHENHRDLPWRHTSDPYMIWISEIIFQQTRISQGLDYYLRFTGKYPDVASLAAAREEDILKMWQGLGYYSRARNLHKAARSVMTDHGGVFPSDYKEIRKLSGIGDYTAAAIASVAFGLPHPVVDGNVLRFFSRYFGITGPVNSAAGKSAILDLALQHIDKKNPGDFNQAVMEFGALHCKPSGPDCSSCVFSERCFAYNHGQVDNLPLKDKGRAPETRHFNYLVFYTGEGSERTLFLKKRTGEDIWKNLYDFPCVETLTPIDQEALFSTPEVRGMIPGPDPVSVKKLPAVKHILTHRVIHASFYEVGVNTPPKGPFLAVTTREFFEYPIPVLIEKFVRKSDIFK